MAKIIYVGLLAAFLVHSGLHSITATQSYNPAARTDDGSTTVVLVADKTTGSIHRFNPVDGTDTVVATGLGALLGIAPHDRHLFTFNDGAQLYQLTFDADWNLVASDLLGSLHAIGAYAGNAIYIEGKNLYTAGPCGIARFRLTAEEPFLLFKEIVAPVNVVSFAKDPAGVLFLADATNGVVYQVGITAGKRDWTTLRPYKHFHINRIAAIATDARGNLLAAISGYPADGPPPVCQRLTREATHSANLDDLPDLPLGLSLILRVEADTKQERVFWSGAPLEFDPATQGVVGLDLASRMVATVSKRSPVTGSNLLLFSIDGQFSTFLSFPDDEIVAAVVRNSADTDVTPQIDDSRPDFSISCTPAQTSIAAGDSAHYTVTVKPTGNWINALDLSMDGLPKGATGQFLPKTIPVGGAETTLTISTTMAMHAGNYPMGITARVITRNPTVTGRRRVRCELRVSAPGR
jgi:hypothetical protein